MQNPKIVFFDIDETLYRKNTDYIPESTILAIKKLNEKGIITAISTGRSLCALPNKIAQLIKDTGIELLSGNNGQYNQYRGEILSSHPINKKEIVRFVNYFKEKGWNYSFINNEKMVVARDELRVKESLEKVGKYIVDADYYLSHDVHQIILFIDEIEEKIFHDSSMLKDDFKTIRWHPLAIDLLPVEASKAYGIITVCEKLNIPIAETMAFGDGLNDIEMFQTVGFAVAMGDAAPELLKYAQYQTGTVEEDGIYQALKKLEVIE